MNKIIDILGGKETPKKFKYNAGTFERQNNGGYIDEDGDNLTEWIFSDYSNIYDEVEIIEEDKKIEKLDIISDEATPNSYYILNEHGTKCYLTKHSKVIADRVNLLIDKVNNMENKQ